MSLVNYVTAHSPRPPPRFIRAIHFTSPMGPGPGSSLWEAEFSNKYVGNRKTCPMFAKTMIYCPQFDWAELWLVNKSFYTVWVQIQWLERIVYTSRFSVIFDNSQICRQMTATPRRSIFHAAKSPQMPYSAPNQDFQYFNDKIKNPLELRLVWEGLVQDDTRIVQVPASCCTQ